MNKRTSVINAEFSTREEGSQKMIEGYFIVFNQETELFKGFYERVSPDAVKDISDVRALYNHNTDLILGSTQSGTLQLVKDEYGVKGTVIINENDSDAVNAYERIKRGDIKGCSFGFGIVNEQYTEREDGTTLATLKDINLFEVSPCVFPAYPQTAINARKKDLEQHHERERKARQSALVERYRR